MCGFAGVIAWDERYRVGPPTLTAMSARIAHRGPDGEGIHFSPEAEISPQRPQIALAHRRLAILDPDPRANQPFADGDGRWIVFNGEIYNFRELRRELSKLQPDYQWRTDGDTEVLLMAYRQWGQHCVNHLNGMFAFVVWDEPDHSIYLARDRMGQKPLYFTTPSSETEHRALAFASELGALTVLPWHDPAINEPALADYLRWGYFGNDATVYRRVAKLMPGSWRRFKAGRAEGDVYFRPNEISPSRSVTPAQIRQQVIQAVGRQLVSDVPLGCFLSGGMDSSVIVAAALAASGGRPMQTFSIGFDDPRYDETRYARIIAERFGTEHHEFVVRPNAAADLPKLARAFGEPFADSSALPTHYLARETRRHVKVALSGDGGDELFGGYERYRAMQWDSRITRLPHSLRKTLAYVSSHWPGKGHPKSAISKLGRFLRTIDQPAGRRYSSYMRLFDDTTILQLFKQPPNLHADFVERQFSTLAQDRDAVMAALATDRVSYLPDDLLVKTDRASMLHALEVRAPFMDHDLIRLAAGVPAGELLAGGPKRMLREAFAGDLPQWVFTRKKMGFAAPIGEWFRGKLKPMLREHLFGANSFAASHFNLPVIHRLVDEHESRAPITRKGSMRCSCWNCGQRPLPRLEFIA